MKVFQRQFAKKEVNYLDHVVRVGVVNPDPARIQCVLQCPRSQTKRDVKAFLGLAGYTWCFVLGYAMMAAPSSDLTRKGSWSKSHGQQSVKKVKQFATTPYM